jgi:hypothetical protein
MGLGNCMVMLQLSLLTCARAQVLRAADLCPQTQLFQSITAFASAIGQPDGKLVIERLGGMAAILNQYRLEWAPACV